MPRIEISDTIVAPATGEGMGAISVIRLSGPDSFRIASAFLFPAKALSSPRPRTAYKLEIRDGMEFIDEAIAVFFKSPASYTGEDMAEIFCHGSPYILRKTLSLAIRHGARQASPGEFTMRAFVNGKMDLAQAEAVNDLIKADGEAAHKAASSQLRGNVSRAVNAVRGKLLDMLSELEVRLDDQDDEIPPLDMRKFAAGVEKAMEETDRLAASFERGKYAKDGIRIVIAGAANSGKSSLFNVILGRERAIVTGIPGTTTDTIEEKIVFSSLPFIFTDTAGINPDPRDLIEKKGVDRSVKAIEESDIIVWLKDGSRPFGKDDEAVQKIVSRRRGKKVIRVLSKADLPGIFSGRGWNLSLSCKTGRGIKPLISRLVKEEKKVFDGRAAAVITSMRHFQALRGASREMEEFIERSGEKEFSPDMAAEHLRAALNSLSEITGEFTDRELLENIFSKFCVGK